MANENLKLFDASHITVVSKLKTKQENCIAFKLVPLIRLLRLLGLCHFAAKKEKGNICYKFDLKDSITKVSIFATFVYLVTFLYGLLQFGFFGYQSFGDDGIVPPDLREGNSYSSKPAESLRLKMASFLMLASQMVSTSHVVISYAFTAITSSKFLDWLNSWNDFDSRINLIYTSIDERRLKQPKLLNCYLIAYIICFVGGFGMMTTVEGLTYAADYPIFFFLYFIYCIGSTSCYVVEDVKAIIMYRAVEQGIVEVMRLLQRCNQNKLLDISILEDLILHLNNQAEICGNILTLSQLSTMLLSVLFASCTIFVVITLIAEGRSDVIFLGVIMAIFATFSICRETTKILVANRIKDKGKELTLLIKQEIVSEKNKIVKPELEELLQTVVTFPIQITLSGFVVLENSLILGIFGQIFTTFIIIMQFSGFN